MKTIVTTTTIIFWTLVGNLYLLGILWQLGKWGITSFEPWRKLFLPSEWV